MRFCFQLSDKMKAWKEEEKKRKWRVTNSGEDKILQVDRYNITICRCKFLDFQPKIFAIFGWRLVEE